MSSKQGSYRAIRLATLSTFLNSAVRGLAAGEHLVDALEESRGKLIVISARDRRRTRHGIAQNIQQNIQVRSFLENLRVRIGGRPCWKLSQLNGTLFPRFCRGQVFNEIGRSVRSL